MKKFFILVLFTLAVFQVTAQNVASVPAASGAADNVTEFPQWAKDIRRWDIVAFGSYPFSIFTITFFTDMNRWNDANGMSFSEEGRRYAPWPLKSAGAVDMTKEQFEQVMLRAAILSAAIAFTDLAIVKFKQYRERRRAENIPSGTVIINKSPYRQGEDEHKNEADYSVNDKAIDASGEVLE